MNNYLDDTNVQQTLGLLGLDIVALKSLSPIGDLANGVIENIYAYDAQQKEGQEKALTKEEKFSYLRAWPVELEAGDFLYRFALLVKPQLILECGTSFGLSTICWASALQINKQGKVITVEVSKLKHAAAQKNFKAAGVEAYIQQETVSFDQYLKKASRPADIVFLDCDRSRYAFYFDQLIPLVKEDSWIIADNAIDRGEDMEEFKKKLEGNSDFITALMPIGDGLLIGKKIAQSKRA